ncbi:MAG: LexA repressor [Porticoccaceae bacterium]|nr:MAG: LexA repressor [Porticoccaceae bacterium]
MKLTPRQAEVLALIEREIATRGRPPTRAEIARALGFRSPNAAEEHLRALARKGAIELETGTARGIRLKAPPAGVPLVGRVAAGEPILAAQHIEEYLSVPADLFRPRAHYFLRVRGDSMCEAGILDGDLLAVHRTDTARDGELVVARVEDEVTVKVLRRRGPHQVLLEPRNPRYAPIAVDLRRQSFAIEGLGVGVLRR